MVRKDSLDARAEEILRILDETPDTPATRAAAALAQARDAGDGALRQQHLREAQSHIARIDPRRDGHAVQRLQAQVLALQGRGGDSRIAHLTPGEIVVPLSVLTPGLRRKLEQAARDAGIDPRSLIVGHVRNAVNPRTGQMEFAEEDLPLAPPGDNTETVTVTGQPIPQLTDDEVNLLGKMIFTEGAPGWKTPGLFQALGSTALNRLGNSNYGNKSLSDILQEPSQFQGVNQMTTPSGKPSLWALAQNPDQLSGPNQAAYAEAQRVAQGLADGTLSDNTGGAIFFGSRDPHGNLPANMDDNMTSGSYQRSRPDMGIWTFARKPR